MPVSPIVRCIIKCDPLTVCQTSTTSVSNGFLDKRLSRLERMRTTLYFNAQCSALMLLRKNILGDYTLSLYTLSISSGFSSSSLPKLPIGSIDHEVCHGSTLGP